MSIVSVQAFVKGQLNNLASPHYKAAQAWITPLPLGDAASSPQIFVATPGYREERINPPRASTVQGGLAGRVLAVHTLKILVLAVYANTDPNNDIAFPGLLNAITVKLRGANIPVAVTDPDTLVTTQLIEVGEDFQVDTDIVRSLANKRLFRWAAWVETKALEVINA